LPGLKSVEQLRREANLAGIFPNLAGQKPNLAGQKPNLAPRNGNLAPTSQVQIREVLDAPNPHKQRAETTLPPNLAPFCGEHVPALRNNGAPNDARILVTTGGVL
jgi:hypothetical protein